MPSFRKRGIVISMLAAVSVLAASCGESKVSQCNKLIEVANKAVSDVQAITTSANPQDVNAMTQIAETADQARASMEALELSDESLQAFKQRFVTMYADTSKATRDLVTAVNANNSQGAEAAYTALQTATDQETPLVNEVNTYCGGTAQ
ncbi:hypothetical protein H6G89_27280 [Oscillatoria sp. FACHB-1407]|uniref:hypothetical protein n=1 Tax=Oscillatoria sp. FACHB-1407 TaxID=2692847 RepID=UPI001686475E|nr:hypothetical protein [Oscillatoria sp. FACHB-1407]MBD2464711.1 hypothetical protein [Oscillatoria sp. FACHB-1407]